MTINYKGATKDYEYRIAEIQYNDEDKKEMEIINRLVFFMNRVKGWDLTNAVAGWAYCEVENKDEYEKFKSDYKEAKRMITNCIKYGF
jgi:hypothetical protein